MLELLEELKLHTGNYRKAVDAIFFLLPDSPKRWRTSFRRIQLFTAQLYLDHLLISSAMEGLEAIALRRGKLERCPYDLHRETKLREELRLKLSCSDSWPGFDPQNSFSHLTGLDTLQDYIATFTLHLPEIYEESFRVDVYTERFLTDRGKADLAALSIGLEHLGRNHAAFVLQSLEWAADEGSWED